MVAGAIGFALLWYDWKRDEKQFRRIVREEIKHALALQKNDGESEKVT